jgi:hypothetical protein
MDELNLSKVVAGAYLKDNNILVCLPSELFKVFEKTPLSQLSIRQDSSYKQSGSGRCSFALKDNKINLSVNGSRQFVILAQRASKIIFGEADKTLAFSLKIAEDNLDRFMLVPDMPKIFMPEEIKLEENNLEKMAESMVGKKEIQQKETKQETKIKKLTKKPDVLKGKKGMRRKARATKKSSPRKPKIANVSPSRIASMNPKETIGKLSKIYG